jgi:hypothetical protein
MVKFAACALFFLITAAATARLLDRLLPPWHVPMVSEKLAYYAAHAGEFDTLFLGSSRTIHHLDPLVFDRLTNEAGVPTKSFNFGVTAMFPPEDGYFVERLLPLHAGRLKRVFIELSFGAPLEVVNSETVRMMYWHDEHRLALVFKEIVTINQPRAPGARGTEAAASVISSASFWKALQAPPGAVPRVSALLVHLQVYLRRFLNIGRGAGWLPKSTTRGAANPALPLEFERTHGARLLPAVENPSTELLSRFERLRTQRERNPGPWLPLSAACEANLKDIVSRVRASGAEPILFFAPELTPWRRFVANEPDLTVFDFSEVGRFPRLFDPAQRVDLGHFNAAGALEFTRAFAQIFLEHEKAHAR